MKLSKLTLVIILSLLASCTGHLSLQNRGCSDNTNILIIEKQSRFPAKVTRDGNKFSVKKKVYTGSKFLKDPEKFKISEILADNGISCNNVKNLSITTKTTGWDNFIGLIPFVSGKTLIIEGELIESVMDDDAVKEESMGEPSA